MAVDFRVEGIGVGEQASGINRIMPAMTAGANRIARGGNSVGVLNVLPNNFKLTGTNISSLGVGEGMASAYGYDLRNDRSQTLNGTPAASGNKYYFVIAEFDLTVIPAVFKIKLHDNGTGGTYTPTPQDNLITSPNGKYNMALYRLTVNTSGAITETLNWASLGVKTIGYSANSENADNYTTKGNLKTKFDALDNKNRDQDTRLDNLGFKSGSCTVVLSGSTTATATVEKQGKYGIINIDITKHNDTDLNPGTSIATLPSGFSAKGTQYILGAGETSTPGNSKFEYVQLKLKIVNTTISIDSVLSTISIKHSSGGYRYGKFRIIGGGYELA